MPSLNSRRPSLSHGHSHTARDGEPIGLGILGRRGTGGEGLSMGMPSSSSRNSLGSGGPASPLRERFSRRGECLMPLEETPNLTKSIMQTLREQHSHTAPDS